MPGEWRQEPFSSAVLIHPPVRLKRGCEYPFVSMDAIGPGSRWVYASRQRAYEGGGSRFQDGDTLLARITPCLENGKIARFKASGYISVAHGSTELIVIRGRAGVTDTGFAYYLTQSPLVRGYAISQMTGTSGRQRVPIEAFEHLLVPIPPLPEQRAIAHILGTLDDKIELNRRMNETLEAMAHALFKSWFVDFDPVHAKAEGRDTGLPPDVAALFPDSFEDSELGQIPKGWQIRSLDQVARFLNGLAMQKYPPVGDKSLPVIKIAQLRSGCLDGADSASADLAPEYIVADGDILFSWSGTLQCVVWAGGRGALNQHLFKVVPTGHPRWLTYYAIRAHLGEFQQIAAGKATTMGHIQRHHLSEARVAIPKAVTLTEVDRVVTPLFESNWKRDVESRSLSTLRDMLLPKLLSGELRADDVGDVTAASG